MNASLLACLIGMQRLDREIFGNVNSPISQTRSAKRSPIFGGGSTRHQVEQRRMPLTHDEIRTLRSFREGVDRKAKKAYVKELRVKYGFAV